MSPRAARHLDEGVLLDLACGTVRGLAARRGMAHLRECGDCRGAAQLYGTLATLPAAAEPALARSHPAGGAGGGPGCPEGEALIRFAAAPAAEGSRTPLGRHVRSCMDCGEELAALARVDRVLARRPLTALATRLPSLVARLRALVRFELPLPLVLNPRGPRAPRRSAALDEGIRALGARRFGVARAALRRARRAGDASPAIDFYQGLLLLEQGQAVAATAALERAARARHRTGETRFFLAQAWLARGRADQALGEFEGVRRVAGPHRDAARSLARRVREVVSTAS